MQCSTLTLLCRHAHQVVLSNLPQHFQSFTLSSAASTEEDMIPAPELNRTVMMRPAYESARFAVDATDKCVFPLLHVLLKYRSLAACWIT
jgi:hypothetical protein